ncbi:two-component regulator propeller domain-containing protein, partial [Ferruginibacter sp.]
ALVIILIYIFAGLINQVSAQQQLLKNYTINDGLVSNTIRRVYQDAKGFLWIATLEGLSKYDGHTFTNYTTANGLSHNMVNDLYENENEQLYIALNNGAIDLLIENKIIPKTGPGDAVINQFLKLSSGVILASTDRNGIQELVEGKIRKANQLFTKKTFTDILLLNDSLFLALEESSIKIFNEKYKLIAEIGDERIINIHSTIYQDSKKRIWVSTKKGLQLLNFSQLKGNEALTFYPTTYKISIFKNTTIRDIFEDTDGVMWFATTEGIVKINPDGTHQRFTTTDGLPSNIVHSIFSDKEKNLWFGTAAGLSKLVTRQSITLYPMEDGFFENNYSYLLNRFKKNYFLVGTIKSIKIFNTLTEKFTPVENSSTENFYDFVLNSKQTTLISYYNMAMFDSATAKLTTINPLPEIYASRVINDKEGYFFSRGVSQLIFKSGDIQQPILNHRISALLLDKNGDLWAGTWQNGVFRIKYNFINNKFEIIAIQNFMPTENIRCLFEDSKGNIWAGTRYQGLYQFTKKEKDSIAITNFDQKKGLTSNFIKGIREDANGNYWIAFYQGIDKLIVNDKEFRIFNFSRVNNYFTSVIGMETDEEHTLWLATNDGLVKIKDGEMEKLPPLPVFITKIFSPDSVYSITNHTLELNHRQNQLQFEFSSPGFINETQLLYSYRLKDGDSTEWSQPSNQHFVSYASLQPGHYNFEVRTMGWNGQWGTPAKFEFIITPPFWQTWWFISLVVFSVLLLTFLLIKWREKNIKIIAEEKLKVQQLDAGQYKSKLEMELIINYFSSSLLGKNTEDDVLWDVAKNLIGRLGFIDCMIYLWNDDKTKMIQRAGFGPKGSIEEIKGQPFDVLPGQGVVGYVMQTKEAVLIADTSKDSRYRPDEMTRLSEIAVPVIYNNELVGVIDCEHHEKNYFTQQQLQILNTIATLMADKIKSIEAEQSLQQKQIEMYAMNEQLSKAKLEALQSQMNPHFIFNSLNAIDNLIQTNQKDKATTYLARFAKLIRNVLDSSKNDVVSFQKDFETLQLYLQLEQFRCSDKFSFKLQADEELLQSDYKVPPLIVQPFVENAIHHGLLNKQDGNKTLTVVATLENDFIKYIIEDNGVGREKAQELKEINKPEHQSYGIEITKERIELYNKSGADNNVIITDLFENNEPSGTKVEICLKVFENN